MDDKSHLPTAAGLAEPNAFGTLDAASIYSMAEECSRWLRDAAECRASIVTPAALTLWSTLAQGDVDHVVKTYNRLLSEIDRRASLADGNA